MLRAGALDAARQAVRPVLALHHVTAAAREGRDAREVRAEADGRRVDERTAAEVVAPRIGGRAAEGRGERRGRERGGGEGRQRPRGRERGRSEGRRRERPGQRAREGRAVGLSGRPPLWREWASAPWRWGREGKTEGAWTAPPPPVASPPLTPRTSARGIESGGR